MPRWLAAFVFDWGAIAAAMVAFERWPGALTGLAAVLLIGTRQHGIAVLGHDGAHGAICRPRWLNDALARACFWPLGIGLKRYRAFHFAHHRWVGTALDPERALKARNAAAWALPASRGRVLWLCGMDFLAWPALRDILPFMALAASPGAVGAALIFWAGVVAVFGWEPLELWFGALVTAFWASNRLRIWTEHQGTDGTHCVRASWWQRFVFLPHNIGWHVEHHEAPGVAFWRLPGRRRQEAVSVGELWERLAMPR